MKTNSVLIIGLIVAIGAVVARRVIFERRAPDETAREKAAVGQVTYLKEQVSTSRPAPRVAQPLSSGRMITSLGTELQADGAASRRVFQANLAKEKTKTQKDASGQSKQPRKPRELADPVARVALIFVGADADAEAYWIDAINDPSISAHERSDLIEDLNEEGFSDPHHPTLEDLPLIVSRLELIEELAPDAMDDVNSDAFAEAKKDLEKMALVAQE